MSRDIVWLKRMFFKDDATGVIDLDTLEDLETESETESDEGVDTKNVVDVTATGAGNNQPNKSGGMVTWGSPLVTGPSITRTRIGRAIKPPDRLTYAPAVELRYLGEMAELDHGKIASTYMALRSMEVALIGAGVGGGISHTSQLKVMNYKKAMRSPDAEEWRKEIRNEKARFDKYNALTAVPRDSLPKGAKVLTTTWAMKQKANGTRRGRLNARGYEQVDGSHYASDSIAAPVTNPITVRIVLMLYCMNRTWTSAIIDVEGAFLQGRFANGEELYIEVPDGFHEWYPVDVVLRMNVPLYGTKQAAYCFFKTFAAHIKNVTYKQSKADPCLYFGWIDGEMVVFVAWVDDVMVLGPPKLVEQVQRDLEKAFT